MKDFPAQFDGHYDYLLHEILESIDDAVLVFGDNENIIYANSAAEDIFGKESKQLLSTSIRALVPKGKYRHIIEVIASLNASGHHSVELLGKKGFIGQRANGHIFVAEGKLAKFANEPAYIFVLRDITMRKAVEEELENALAHLKIVGSKVAYRFEHPRLLEEFPAD